MCNGYAIFKYKQCSTNAGLYLGGGGGGGGAEHVQWLRNFEHKQYQCRAVYGEPGGGGGDSFRHSRPLT